jgi:hypothetical protein
MPLDCVGLEPVEVQINIMYNNTHAFCHIFIGPIPSSSTCGLCLYNSNSPLRLELPILTYRVYYYTGFAKQTNTSITIISLPHSPLSIFLYHNNKVLFNTQVVLEARYVARKNASFSCEIALANSIQKTKIKT